MAGEPVFPREIERRVLGIAALMHRGTIPTLLYESRAGFSSGSNPSYFEFSVSIETTNSRSLPLDFRGFTDPLLLPLFAKLRLRRLAVHLLELFRGGRIHLYHPLFWPVTDLDLFSFQDVMVEALVLSDRPRLEPVLIRFDGVDKDLYELAKISHEYDVRDDWRDWEGGVQGAPAQGDDFVVRKRNGEIEVCHYQMISTLTFRI
ncbi:hypothetical protein B0H12DRAFT_1073894 [Mycena haematopus]|nr:hypothetical protein B0H12DRAFT_1073894 [Mycena haematopus]